MAECHDFFVDSTPSLCRSSSSVAVEHDDRSAHSLDLTLGLASSGGPSSHSPCHRTLRPVAVYPQLRKVTPGMSHTQADHTIPTKLCGGNFGVPASADVDMKQPQTSSTFTASTDAALAVKSLFSAAENAFPSRDQIWQTLQRNGAVSVQDSQKMGRMNSLQTETPEARTRRAASMQVLMPSEGTQDMDNNHILRSRSYGVQSNNLSRQISSIESSSESRHQGQHPETPEDAQKRKDLQAKRRQEARKRRKLLNDKKTKQNTGLQRLNSRQSLPPNEKFNIVSLHSSISANVKIEDLIGDDERSKSCPSTETEGVENASGQNDTSELDSSSQKSTIENTGAASAVPLHHPHSPPSKVSADQASFVVPVMGVPATHSLPNLHRACLPTSFSLPVIIPPSSGEKSGFALTDCARHVVEGIGGSCERSAFTPLQRTTTSIQQTGKEPWSPGLLIDSQGLVLAPQLSSVSDNVGIKNLPMQRQQSVPFTSRLPSQSSCVKDPSIMLYKDERPHSSAGALERRHATSADVCMPSSGKADIKMEEGLKQLEVSSEGHRASEHSGLEAATYYESGVLEKQRSTVFSNAKWVTTTGKGPHGKTIHGVMYLEPFCLICTCHGLHMSPAGFVEHSGSSDLSNPLRSIYVSPFPFLNR